jgi:HD-GYP domain-containing protein (c-di-GMP phosphodiesterase class II)
MAGSRTQASTRRKVFNLIIFAYTVAMATFILAAATLFVGLGATLLSLCFLLWIALWRLSRRAGRGQAFSADQVTDIRNGYESIIALLADAVVHRDAVTAAHARRLSRVASVVAWEMGLRKQDVIAIEKAATLHDIGKLGIAGSVLSAPGPLTEEQWAEMRRHPQVGYEALRGIPSLSGAAEIVHSHHERFDGSGYSGGLKAQDIPICARLYAVADAYAAMTSDRPYRKARPHAQAVNEITQNAGTQFDPEVVRAFIRAEKKGLFSARTSESPGRAPVAAEV